MIVNSYSISLIHNITYPFFVFISKVYYLILKIILIVTYIILSIVSPTPTLCPRVMNTYPPSVTTSTINQMHSPTQGVNRPTTIKSIQPTLFPTLKNDQISKKSSKDTLEPSEESIEDTVLIVLKDINEIKNTITLKLSSQLLFHEVIDLLTKKLIENSDFTNDTTLLGNTMQIVNNVYLVMYMYIDVHIAMYIMYIYKVMYNSISHMYYMDIIIIFP